MHERFNNLESLIRLQRGSAEAYLSATVLVVLASLARWGLGFIGQPLLPFTAFYPALLFATYIGGVGVGCYAAILGGLIGWWAFLPPQFSFFATKPFALEIMTYAVTTALIVWGADSYRRLAHALRITANRLQDEEKLRKLAIEELAHRLKNKIATIQSIINFQLREQPQIRDDLNRRLGALSTTDDLIMAAQGAGAAIRDIFVTELRAYDIARTPMEGPDVFLPPTLALTTALLVHELATNAAKHGALTTASGTVSVYWSVADGILELNWRETGGPTVAQPTHRGFGLRPISGALHQFNGSAEMNFEPTGLTCKMKATLPEGKPNIAPAAPTDKELGVRSAQI